MKVSELIEKLKALPQDHEVYVGSSETYPAGEPTVHARNAEWAGDSKPIDPMEVVELVPVSVIASRDLPGDCYGPPEMEAEAAADLDGPPVEHGRD